jgi:hypothetical protein
MREVLRYSLTTLGLIGLAVGIFFGVPEDIRVPAAIVAVMGSIAVGAAIVGWRRYSAVSVRLRQASEDRGRLSAVEEEVERLRIELEHERQGRAVAVDQARMKAATAMKGVVLAAIAGACPVIKSIAASDSDLVLFAESIAPAGTPPRGARYGLEATATGEFQGVFEVRDETGDGLVRLSLIRAAPTAYMRELRRAAILDQDAARTARLVHITTSSQAIEGDGLQMDTSETGEGI